MAITQRSIKILWSAAAGRCAFPGCMERLCYHEADKVAPYTIGQMAHICGDKPDASRHDPTQTDVERDDYQNLILLCPTDHTRIDRKETEAIFTVATLHEMKAAHEAEVSRKLDRGGNMTKGGVARQILPLLEENRLSWAQYGPMSDLARSQPHNEAVHAVWVSERLSVIVPNNRKIVRLLEGRRSLFKTDEQGIVATFLLHVRSYESWVDDRTPYAAVRRFPAEFDSFIRENANDCA